MASASGVGVGVGVGTSFARGEGRGAMGRRGEDSHRGGGGGAGPSRASVPGKDGGGSNAGSGGSKAKGASGGAKVAKGGVTSDPRFAHVHSDPRFQRMRLEERKVKIDDRFKAMFEDEKFAGSGSSKGKFWCRVLERARRCLPTAAARLVCRCALGHPLLGGIRGHAADGVLSCPVVSSSLRAAPRCVP